ncbi:glycosyltransferase family 4 protein [Neisseriaceae bacterium B1]
MEKYIVNHVMSNNVQSGIFKSILDYFVEFGSTEFQHVVTDNPVEDAAIYHYHRPHLESKLLSNSVCTVHHDLNDPDPWHSKYRFIPRYQEAAKIVCLNSSQKEILIEQGLKENNCVVIPHGYNEKVLQLRENRIETGSKITLGMASRRYGRRVKGEAYLFELAKRLDPDCFRFIFIGKDRLLSALVLRELGFETKFYERLPYRLFQAFYNEIDVLLMCSSHEGGPANIPEALATGTPIFSSNIGISKDVITDGKNGLLLTLNPDIDAERIQEICLNQPELFVDIKKNSLNSTHLAITWEECIKRNIELYWKIIQGEQ